MKRQSVVHQAAEKSKTKRTKSTSNNRQPVMLETVGFCEISPHRVRSLLDNISTNKCVLKESEEYLQNHTNPTDIKVGIITRSCELIKGFIRENERDVEEYNRHRLVELQLPVSKTILLVNTDLELVATLTTPITRGDIMDHMANIECDLLRLTFVGLEEPTNFPVFELKADKI